ncbi:alpha/beta-hydrolase [Exidia glandulosa HHB12029]|uniref:Alpha/beta-hydrolase n=1 Tax=Exidia glandulosa HHB12029 TaxID=1314781 RepID=A0A165NB70_EXIGL|nr:alpha/beta-hydrolase [Exidia glandulosa HHB12029]
MSSFLPSLQTFVKGAAATTVAVGSLGISLLYYGQNYLIYPSAYPPGSRTEVPTPSEWNLLYEDLTLHTPDDVSVRAYLMLQRQHLAEGSRIVEPGTTSDDEYAARRPTVIMFHGNGGNIGHRVPLARIFFLKMRCNVLMLSYRGYGLSEGRPSEKGIRIDAQTALDYLLAHPVLRDTKIVIYGQSIGGAVGIDLASRNPDKISALVLENTFLSLPRLIPSALPMLGPFAFLCHQIWDSANALPKIPASTPILMLSGLLDEVIPPSHMTELFHIACETGRTKGVWRDFPEGSHNNTCVQPGYWSAVEEFIAAL